MLDAMQDGGEAEGLLRYLCGIVDIDIDGDEIVFARSLDTVAGVVDEGDIRGFRLAGKGGNRLPHLCERNVDGKIDRKAQPLQHIRNGPRIGGRILQR